MKFNFKDVELPGDLDGAGIINLVNYFEKNFLPHFLLKTTDSRILAAKFTNDKRGGKWVISGKTDVNFNWHTVDFIGRVQGKTFNSATDIPMIGADLFFDYVRIYWKSGFIKRDTNE